MFKNLISNFNPNDKMDLADRWLFAGSIVKSESEVNGKKFSMYKNPLKINWSPSFPKNLMSKHLSIVYLIFVGSNLMKIGQTSGKGGLKACLNFYLNAGTDSPGFNRFAINYLMRGELDKGNEVKVFMSYMENIMVKVPTLMGETLMSVPVSAKGAEEASLEEYKKAFNRYPPWNFQENSESLPKEIEVSFADYRKMRAES